MNSILRELYYGRIFPAEDVIPKDPEYQSASQKIDQIKAHLKTHMPEADRIRLAELECMYDETSEMQAEAAFECGFSLGVRLMAEAFSESTGK